MLSCFAGNRSWPCKYKGKDTILLCSQTAAENKGVGCYRVGHQLVIFKDGLSDEQSQAAVAEINKLTDFAMPLSELRAASQRYVYEQLIRLAPILISVVMLIFVSTVAITTLNMKMNMRTSAIYALHGCTMKGCSMIYLINSLIVTVISVMLCTAFMNILALKGFFEKTVVTVDIHTVIGCAGVCGAFLVCSLVSPVIGLGRASIKESEVWKMIKLDNIVKIYNPKKSNEFEALHGVSCEINDGELVAIIGKSGAGKSTLLHILACIDSYQDGEYKIDDTLVKGLSERKYARIRNEKIGMVMQDFALVEDFTALENVMIPLNFSKKKIKGKKEKALAALRSVGIEELAKKPCNKLSGGQKQRVAIARAIVNEPSMILDDEPTGALDTKTSAEIMELFKSLNEQGRTVVIVTHDPKVAEQCGRIIEISDGEIVGGNE